MNPLQKLPPHVARELRRHIAPPKRPSQTNTSTTVPNDGAASTSRNQKSWVLPACLALTATAASFPLLASWWIDNLSSRDKPLTAPQVRRGAFLNSGTRDVGKDPDWDFTTGKSKNQVTSGYSDDEAKKKQRSAPYLAMPVMLPEEREKYEEEMIAFAKGERRNKRWD
jgi:hypothetical protein